MKLTKYQQELQHMRNDSFTDFEKRLINNEITCIKSYFEDHFPLQKIHRKIMAQHGLYIDKLIEINDNHVNAELVRRGHAKEYYEEWAENGEHDIQEALLEKELHIDILSQSKDEDIQFEVAKQYPELTLDYLKSVNINHKRSHGFSYRTRYVRNSPINLTVQNKKTNPLTSHYHIERISQTLYWQGETIPRDSERYQEMLDKAFNALAENSSFRRALLTTQNATLTHNIGKKNHLKQF